jgi:hypothetical protein
MTRRGNRNKGSSTATPPVAPSPAPAQPAAAIDTPGSAATATPASGLSVQPIPMTPVPDTPPSTTGGTPVQQASPESLAFDYVISTLLDIQDPTHPIFTMMDHEGIGHDIANLTCLHDDEFMHLMVAIDQPLARGYKNLLRIFTKFSYYVSLIDKCGKPLAPEEWFQIPKERFNEYRLKSPDILDSEVQEVRESLRPKARAGLDPHEKALSDFRKSIKRDISQYPTLKDEKNWDTFHRTFLNTIRAHDLEHVTDPDYEPEDESEEALFTHQQSFVYSVLERCLLTDMGKTIVRKHAHDYDAREVYLEYKKHMTESTKATMTASNLMTWITTAQYDSTWKGQSERFILHWLQKVRLLHDLVDEEAKLCDSVLLTLLQNAVRPVPELRQVQTDLEVLHTSHRTPPTYQRYQTLLLSAAQRFDSDGKKNSSSRSLS